MLEKFKTARTWVGEFTELSLALLALAVVRLCRSSRSMWSEVLLMLPTSLAAKVLLA